MPSSDPEIISACPRLPVNIMAQTGQSNIGNCDRTYAKGHQKRQFQTSPPRSDQRMLS